MTCKARRDLFQGWEACILENEFVRLVAVPAVGGRIMAFDLGSYPFFFVDPALAGKLFTPEENQGDGSLAAWKNYGGDKTWPAPQGWDSDQQWHGPPDPILDSGIYTVDSLTADGDSARVVMTSPPDPRTGVQITRAFTLWRGFSRVTVDLAFRNHTDHPIRWSIWDVAQLRAERRDGDGALTHEPQCVVTAPLNPRSVFPHSYSVMFGAPDNPQWQTDPAAGLFIAPYGWQIGKIGLDSPAGWIAFSNAAAGCAFTESFTYQPDAEYPDGGATVEVWTTGAGQVGSLNYEGSDIYLMETEVLSPLTTIKPRGSAHFRILWGACRADGAILSVSDAGAVTQPLSMTSEANDFVRVRFRGGVFEPGMLRLLWKNRSGDPVAALPLGEVDPLTLVMLDRVLHRPHDGCTLELCIGQHTLARIDNCK
jgi:hypothetical protein